MAKSEWVRVRSEDELRPGMVLRRVREIPGDNGPLLIVLGRLIERMPLAWYETNSREYPYNTIEPFHAIRDGRLYRLADLDEADETTEVAKGLEVTRG